MKFLFLDTETTGLDETTDQLHGVSYCLDDGDPAYVSAGRTAQDLEKFLVDPGIKKVLFNARFDLRFLERVGLHVNGPVYDVMHMAQQVDENQPLGLKPLSEKYLGADSLSNKAALDAAMHAAGVKNLGAFCRMDLLDPTHPYFDVIAKYGVEDVVNTRSLFYLFMDKMKETDKKLRTVLKVKETPLTNYLKDVAPVEPVLLKMELSGVRVDPEKIERVRADATTRRDELLSKLSTLTTSQIKKVEEQLIDLEIKKHVARLKSEARKAEVVNEREEHRIPFNWESAPHVGKLFFEQYSNLPLPMIRKTKSGQYAMDETFLKNFPDALPKRHPLLEVLPLYAAYKKTLKIIGTYTGTDKKGIAARIRKDENGEPTIYAQFGQLTTTGRLNHKRPNFANLPKNSPIKSFFIPKFKDTVFLYSDFSQLQLRIAAHVSRDPVMMEAYQLDQDLHRRTAATMFQIEEGAVNDDKRDLGKTTNFAAIFGASEWRLLGEFREKNGLDYTIEECKAFRDALFADWKVYARYLEQQLAFCKKYRFVISETGRIRRLPDIVFGDHLNYRRREFVGPRELAIRLLEHPNEKMPDSRELFFRASKKFRHATNQAYCSPIQGLESSIMKRCMVQLDKAGYQIRNQIHDAIILEVGKVGIEKAKKEVSTILTTTYPLRVPLKADCKIINSFDEKDLYKAPTARIYEGGPTPFLRTK